MSPTVGGWRGWPRHREIWRIAAPMILTNVSIPLIGLVDTAVLGHLPDPAYLGAVAVGAMIFSFVFWGFNFLRMGTTGIVAQAWGRGEPARVSRTLWQALALAGGCALALIALRGPLLGLALGLTEASPEVETGAATYFSIRVLGAPLTLASNAFVGWFLGLSNARAPMAMLLVANLANVALDLCFVVGLGWGVAGVALASVAGELLAVILGALLAAKTGRLRRPRLREVLDRTELRAMARLNRDIALRTLCLLLVMAFVPWWGARLGEVTLAANAVLMNFQHFASYALDGLAHAAEALVGRALGAGRPAAFRRAVWRTGCWSLGVAFLFALGYASFGGAVIDALTSLPEVRAIARTHLPWLVLLPVWSVWSFWLDGIFIGATWARGMLQAMLVSSLLVFLPAWWLARGLGNHGLWLAFSAFMLARGLSMGWIYLRRRPGGAHPGSRRAPAPGAAGRR